MAKTKVILTGPLFDGSAGEAAAELTRALAREIAEIGATWIKIEAHGMDKSGRGGTGQAAGGVEVIGRGPNWVVRGGIRQGEYAWPWLEGTSRRNQSTGFKGYRTFRRTRLRMRRQVTPWAQGEVARYVARMGGAAL